MKYEGNLIITTGNASDFSELVEVTGYLEINADAQLPKLTKAHGKFGKLICVSEYGLWASEDGKFYAGCRTDFTKEKALEHWDREDERARKFTAAILAI